MGEFVLVLGVVFGAFAVTGALAAWAEGHSLKRPVSLAVISGSCIVFAHLLVPGGVSVDYVPIAVIKVVDGLTDIFLQ